MIINTFYVNKLSDYLQNKYPDKNKQFNLVINSGDNFWPFCLTFHDFLRPRSQSSQRWEGEQPVDASRAF